MRNFATAPIRSYTALERCRQRITAPLLTSAMTWRSFLIGSKSTPRKRRNSFRRLLNKKRAARAEDTRCRHLRLVRSHYSKVPIAARPPTLLADKEDTHARHDGHFRINLAGPKLNAVFRPGCVPCGR